MKSKLKATLHSCETELTEALPQGPLRGEVGGKLHSVNPTDFTFRKQQPGFLLPDIERLCPEQTGTGSHTLVCQESGMQRCA